jgi:hypothetical protein
MSLLPRGSTLTLVAMHQQERLHRFSGLGGAVRGSRAAR